MKIINKNSGAYYGYYVTLDELCDAILYDLNLHEDYIVKFDAVVEMNAAELNRYLMEYPTVTPVDSIHGVTKGEIYKVLARFKTNITGSGLCVVISTDRGEIKGYCATNFHFLK